MERIIQKIFNPLQAPSAIKLLQDKETRILVIREVGLKVLESEAVLPSPIDQLLAIASLADFAEEDECLEVAGIIYRHLPDLDVLPALTVHRGRELGERCLIGLSFFSETLHHRHIRHGAPSPDFYRQVGRARFRNEGLEEISNHFVNWESFLSERLL